MHQARGSCDSRDADIAQHKMGDEQFGVDLLEADVGDDPPPFCPHGPVVLFVRYFEKKAPRKFFACSCCRDRKLCPFFYWADEKITEEKRERWYRIFLDSKPKVDRMTLLDKLSVACRLEDSDRRYCHNCCELLVPSEWPQHQAHDVTTGLSREMLANPSHFLKPLTERKSHAFFYSQETTDFLSSELKRQGFTHVVCIGVPRLHENLITKHGGSMSSLLLDIDHRYLQFYSREAFQHYNMLNGFFFEDEGPTSLCSFVSKDLEKTVLVVDPPFGALAGLIARHLKGMWTMLGHEIKTIITFPYFLEQKLLEHLTNFSMCEYQVTYDNHSVFNDSRKDRPSAVRFFANLPSPGLKLLKQDGYRFCSVCSRYVARNNRHCHVCNTCPSKDGRPYVHCNMCQKCVKPGRVHCTSCERCDVVGHVCGREKLQYGCHICGQFGHKRKECPRRKEVLQEAKRSRKRPVGRQASKRTKRRAVLKKNKK